MKQLQNIVFLLLSLVLSNCTQTDTSYQGYVDVEYTNLSTQTSDIVISIPVSKGMQVHSGDLLLQLDDTKEKLQIEELQAQLKREKNILLDMKTGKRILEQEIIAAQLKEALAALDNASNTYKRYQTLYKQENISASDFESKEASYKEAKARVESITYELELAKEGNTQYQIQAQEASIEQLETKIKEVEYLRSLKFIHSPVNATVYDVFYHKGELLAQGHIAIQLIQPEQIKVRFFVPQNIAQSLQLGKSVSIITDKTLQGTITYISPTSEFTPPVIYSDKSNKRLVFMVEAKPEIVQEKHLIVGQPVKVMIDDTE